MRGRITRDRKHFRGYDLEKVARILMVLQEYPSGVHLRGLAHQAGIPPSTLSRYLQEYLDEVVESLRFPEEGRPLIRIVRLGAHWQGRPLEELLRIVRMFHRK